MPANGKPIVGPIAVRGAKVKPYILTNILKQVQCILTLDKNCSNEKKIIL